jgi:thiamine biosynthesis lipoprotein
VVAEIRAKAAILSGPRGAGHWLPDGGVIVLDDGTHRVLS